MDRLTERLRVARRALETFREALREPKTPLNRDASIQRFEYTYEAVWKTRSYICASGRISNWLLPPRSRARVFKRRFSPRSKAGRRWT